MNEGASPASTHAVGNARPAAPHILPLTAVVAVFGLLLIIGAASPWGSLDLIGTPIKTIKGTDTETLRGRAVFALGFVVIALCLLRVVLPELRNVYFLAGGAIAIYVIATLVSTVSDLSMIANQYETSIRGIQITDVHPESGLYVTIFGAIGLPIALALQYYIEQRQS